MIRFAVRRIKQRAELLDRDDTERQRYDCRSKTGKKLYSKGKGKKRKKGQLEQDPISTAVRHRTKATARGEHGKEVNDFVVVVVTTLQNRKKTTGHSKHCRKAKLR